MRSTPLAVLAVAAGSGLLAWSTAGVSGISATLPAAAPISSVRADPGSSRSVDFTHDHGRHDDHDGDGPHQGRPEA